jgi:ribosomal protein S18 acetylase RimI-like enzyme
LKSPSRVVATVATPPDERIVDLDGPAREAAVPVLIDSFVGIYRWHAKRTLRDVDRVRALRTSEGLAGIAMLETIAPAVGYVYYIAVYARFRRRGVGGHLLDDALEQFRSHGYRVVYAAAEEDNAESIALFRSRGFRIVEKKERNYREGGLGAWGLRSKMWIVSGEVLLGLRLTAEPSASGGAPGSGGP